MVRKLTVVDKVLARVHGSHAELARRLSEISGQDISRQRVYGWESRGVFPRDMMVHVEALYGISLEELATAPRKEPDDGNIVQRAIRLLGVDANAATLAAELGKLADRRITRQMVSNWLGAEQFPTDVVPFVHLLVHIPVKELLEGRRRTRGKRTRRGRDISKSP